MKAEDKYGIAEATKQCWIPAAPDYQIVLDKGDVLYGGLDWVAAMAGHKIPYMQGRNLQSGRCLKLKGRMAHTDIRMTTTLPSESGRVLILRYGGLGDLIMLTALLRWFTEQGIPCGLACSYEHSDAMRELLPPEVKVHPVPGNLKDIEEYDTILIWELIEHDRARFEDKARLGAYVYADAVGVPITNPQPWLPRLQHSPKREAHLQKLNSMGVDTLVVIQLTGSTISKSPPHAMMLEVARELAHDYTVIVTARESDMRKMDIGVKDIEQGGVLLATDKVLGSTMDWVCLVSLADLVIAPDSAALHIAVATGQRAIGLFCPTSSEQWYPTGYIYGIHSECPDFGCMTPGMNRLAFPCDRPRPDGYGSGWDSITVSDVVVASKKKLLPLQLQSIGGDS